MQKYTDKFYTVPTANSSKYMQNLLWIVQKWLNIGLL